MSLSTELITMVFKVTNAEPAHWPLGDVNCFMPRPIWLKVTSYLRSSGCGKNLASKRTIKKIIYKNNKQTKERAKNYRNKVLCNRFDRISIRPVFSSANIILYLCMNLDKTTILCSILWWTFYSKSLMKSVKQINVRRQCFVFQNSMYFLNFKKVLLRYLTTRRLILFKTLLYKMAI